MQKLIILDRDGVINFDSKDYIKNPQEWKAIPGSLSAISQLNQHGFTVVIATNQSGLGRGYYSLQDMHNIHEKLQQELNLYHGKITKIFYCPHHPDDNCDCRKPKIGLFEQIKNYFNLTNFNHAISIGDSYRDYQAARQANCHNFILVKTGNGLKTLHEYPDDCAKIIVKENLAAAVSYILSSNY